MTFEELRETWIKGGAAAVIAKLPAPFLIPLEPWVRASASRRTLVGPAHTPVPRFPEDLDVTDTARNSKSSLALVHSQLGDRFPAGGIAIALVKKTDRNVYAHIAVGRSDNNDIVVDQPSVSRFHADFRLVDTSFAVRDAKSRNGTRRNGEPLGDGPSVKLVSGDVVSFGDATYLFCLPNEQDLTTALGRIGAK